MASDLAATPRSGLTAHLCGDAHLLNRRLLCSPERQRVFEGQRLMQAASGRRPRFRQAGR